MGLPSALSGARVTWWRRCGCSHSSPTIIATCLHTDAYTLGNRLKLINPGPPLFGKRKTAWIRGETQVRSCEQSEASFCAARHSNQTVFPPQSHREEQEWQSAVGMSASSCSRTHRLCNQSNRIPQHQWPRPELGISSQNTASQTPRGHDWDKDCRCHVSTRVNANRLRILCELRQECLGNMILLLNTCFAMITSEQKTTQGQCKTMLELTAFSVRSYTKRHWIKSEGLKRVASCKRDRHACVRHVENFHQLSDKATDEVLYVFGRGSNLSCFCAFALGSALATNYRRDRLHYFVSFAVVSCLCLCLSFCLLVETCFFNLYLRVFLGLGNVLFEPP